MRTPTDEEAKRLLDWLAHLQTGWKEKLEALREVRGDSPLRNLASLVAYTLEMGEHLSLPAFPELADDFAPAGKEMECPQCHNRWVLEYPGQPYCSHACADIARGVRKMTVMLPAAERRSATIGEDEAAILESHGVGISFKRASR